jgi:hypothetical protein
MVNVLFRGGERRARTRKRKYATSEKAVFAARRSKLIREMTCSRYA